MAGVRVRDRVGCLRVRDRVRVRVWVGVWVQGNRL